MTENLTNKFSSISSYFSKIDEPENSGLKQLMLKTYLEIDQQGIIKMDVWLAQTDFLNKPLIIEIIKSQTVFEFDLGITLNEEELFQMFQFAEQKLMEHQPFLSQGQKRTIKDLFPTEYKLEYENMREILKGSPEYISSLKK